MSDTDGLCQLCYLKKFKYVCPKCNIPYCSLDCYRRQNHLKCSEEFYKSCIQDDIAAKDPNSREDMTKIYNILKRLRETDAGIEPEDFTNEPLDSDDDDDDEVASDNESDIDLANRLKGVNLNDSEKIWEKLTENERLEFQKLIDSNEIMKLLPKQTPWWEKKCEPKFVVLPSKGEPSTFIIAMPKIVENIPNFLELTKKTPSPCLRYNLWNIFAAYTCTIRFFDGDHIPNAPEAAAHLFNLSTTLKYGTNFESADDAIISVEMEALTTEKGMTTDHVAVGVATIMFEGRDQLQKDTRRIMSFKKYQLAALSDILQLMKLAKRQAKLANPEKAEMQKLLSMCISGVSLDFNKLQNLLKKMEFFLAYVNMMA